MEWSPRAHPLQSQSQGLRLELGTGRRARSSKPSSSGTESLSPGNGFFSLCPTFKLLPRFTQRIRQEKSNLAVIIYGGQDDQFNFHHTSFHFHFLEGILKATNFCDIEKRDAFARAHSRCHQHGFPRIRVHQSKRCGHAKKCPLWPRSGGGDDPRAEAGHQVQLHPGQLGAEGVVGAAHLQRHATSLHRFGQEWTVDPPNRQFQHFSGLSSRRLVSRMTARP